MDAPTVGVLRDTALLAWLALLFGVMAYQIMRVAFPHSIPSIGKVQVGAYVSGDGLIVAALSMLLLGGLFSAAPAAEENTAEAAVLSVPGLWVAVIFQLMVCVGVLLYLRQFRKENPAEMFGLWRISPSRALITGFLALVPAWVLVTACMYFLNDWMKGFWPALQGQELVESFRKSDDVAAKALLALSAAVFAPLMEEVVFRGFIYGFLKRYTDGIFAAICSSLLFGVVHMHVGTMFPLVILALAFCAAYEFTGCLFVPMIMHAIFNATSLVLMILFPDMAPN